MDGHQALNLSAKNQGRGSTGGAGSNIRHSASTSALSRQGPSAAAAAAAAAAASPFDLLSALGGDMNSAMAALAAAANSGLYTIYKYIDFH